MNWISDVFSMIGSIPISILPSGVSYWLALFGIQALIGGIVSGLTISLTIIFLKAIAGKILRLFNPLSAL